MKEKISHYQTQRTKATKQSFQPQLKTLPNPLTRLFATYTKNHTNPTKITMPAYTINEPTPTFAAGSYTHSGRGGAGNIFRVNKESAEQQAALSQASSKASSKTSTHFYSGRGGAGNAHKSVPKPVLSFDEEFERAVAQESVAVGHVGRGGAGNVFGASSSKSEATADSRRSSAEDNRSIRSGFWARISGASVGSHH